MTKVLQATCENGVVKVGDVTIDALILSAGVNSSTGILILQDDRPPVYIASSAEDLDLTIGYLIALITDLASALTTISSTLTAIGAGMTGPTTAPPPTLPTDVATLTSKVTSMNATKVDLQTLKGDLT